MKREKVAIMRRNMRTKIFTLFIPPVVVVGEKFSFVSKNSRKSAEKRKLNIEVRKNFISSFSLGFLSNISLN